jgi:hypothetical protein
VSEKRICTCGHPWSWHAAPNAYACCAVRLENFQVPKRERCTCTGFSDKNVIRADGYARRRISESEWPPQFRIAPSSIPPSSITLWELP